MDTTLNINDDPSDSDLVYRLKARIRELEAAFGSEWRAPRVLRLSPWEERLLGALIIRRAATCDAIYNVLYGDRLNPPEGNIVNVHLHNIRKKLRLFGVEILTNRGRGVEIDDANLSRLNALYNSEATS